MTARGIRNNNPGNIERGKVKWQGAAEDQSSDPRFVVFRTPQFGIRAIAKTLLTYNARYKLDTVEKIINRWAPPGENDTGAYVSAVARDVGVAPDQHVEVDSVEVMLPLVKGIIQHENGVQPYSDGVIKEALHMAGVSDARPKPLAKSPAFLSQVGGGVAVAGAGVAQFAEPVKKVADQLAPYSTAPWIQNVVMALVTVAGLCALGGAIALWIEQRRK